MVRRKQTVTAMKHARRRLKPCTERVVEYHKTDPRFRVVSRPCGLYCAQWRLTEKGDRNRDNWNDIGAHVPLEAARMQRDAYARRGGPASIRLIGFSGEAKRSAFRV